MTDMTPKSRGQFNSLKLSTMNAISEAFSAETAALEAGDDDAADELFAKRNDLTRELGRIREAEIRYLNSEKGAAEAEKILQTQAAEAKRLVKKMKKVTKTLGGLTKMINLLAKLPALF